MVERTKTVETINNIANTTLYESVSETFVFTLKIVITCVAILSLSLD